MGHSYYTTPIGSHRWSIKWYHFQNRCHLANKYEDIVMPEQHRHLANKREDGVNLHGAVAYCVATRTASFVLRLSGVLCSWMHYARAPYCTSIDAEQSCMARSPWVSVSARIRLKRFFLHLWFVYFICSFQSSLASNSRPRLQLLLFFFIVKWTSSAIIFIEWNFEPRDDINQTY